MAESPDTKTQNTPGGSVPEYKLWQHRVEQSSGQEKAHVDPEGKSHVLQEGERFSVKLDRAANRYDAVVIDKDGKERVVGTGPMNSALPSTEAQQKTAETPLNINKDRLNEIMRLGSERGATFGRQLQFTDADRQDIRTITEAMHAWLDSQLQNNAEWNDLNERIDKAEKTGQLIALSPVFPPTWLINGGQQATMQDKYENGHWSVTVPDRIYNLYYWQGRAEELDRFASRTDQTLKGTNTKGLIEPLRDAAHFLRSIGRL